MAAAAKLIRHALSQQVRSTMLSGPSTGLPLHSSQANLLSLQVRQLSQLTSLQNSGSWCHPQTGCLHSYKSLLVFPTQQNRGMAEQASQAKKDKPDQPAVSGNRPAGPVSHARGGMIKAVFISPNVLMEPYKGPGGRLPFLQSWLTLPGWRARKDRVMSNIKSMYAIAKLKKNVKGFGLRAFKEDALQVYKETCQLLADGDQSRLRQATTPALFDNMKREIRARQDGGWKAVRWSMLKPPKLGQMDIVHGRIMAQNPKDDKTAWVQLTVTIPSEQSFAAYNSKRELVAGNPDVAVKVVDTWVFERALKKDPSTRWRCAGRLSFQPSLQVSSLTSSTTISDQSEGAANGINQQGTAQQRPVGRSPKSPKVQSSSQQRGSTRGKPAEQRSKQRIQAAAAVL